MQDMYIKGTDTRVKKPQKTSGARHAAEVADDCGQDIPLRTSNDAKGR